ncbi:hypothetical protein ACFLYQ_05190 [Chloroflexota bacterium]
MENPVKNPEYPHSVITGDNEAIRHFKQAINEGTHWYIALLEAIGLWETAEETINGRSYHYLIADEAFDWLLLAERLCEAMEGLLPEEEKTALLFYGKPPVDLSADEFKKLIGNAKYNHYLNYFYGIIVEEALVTAVKDEVRKESHVSGYLKEIDASNEAYQRIYGSTKADLLMQFRQKRKHPQLKSASLTELKEFTYWLFRHRFKQCDSAKVASDTKKALDWLEDKGYFRHSEKQDFKAEFVNIPPS